VQLVAGVTAMVKIKQTRFRRRVGRSWAMTAVAGNNGNGAESQGIRDWKILGGKREVRGGMAKMEREDEVYVGKEPKVRRM